MAIRAQYWVIVTFQTFCMQRIHTTNNKTENKKKRKIHYLFIYTCTIINEEK